MKTQSYNNHRKFHFSYHFIYLPLLLILQILGIYKSITAEDNYLIWILFSVIIFLIFYLAIMLRQHYALGLQNRLVRLEFKQRYFEIFNERSDDIEEKLNFGQIAALRFAYDEEFKELLQKVLEDNISGDQIKKSIKKWRTDNHRV